ncbi:MAG: flagellar motor protein MotB [Paracoccaceae bacterium]
MAGEGDVRPLIVKRKKVVSGGGHHGGAWKVAYADFVTAMMAFFLLLWLLNATTEKQRKGLADYFNPSIPVHRISGGGNEAFAGDNILSSENLSRAGAGAEQKNPATGPAETAWPPTETDAPTGSSTAADNDLARLEAYFNASSGESEIADDLLEHVRTRVTDEGLIVELFDLEGSPLFFPQTSRPTGKMTALLRMIAGVAAGITNRVAVTGHTSAVPVVQREKRNWELSAARAQASRIALTQAGLADARMQRVVGKADREPADGNPMAARNRRIEITFLRAGPDRK